MAKNKENDIIDFILSLIMIGSAVYILCVIWTQWYSGKVLG